MRHFKKSLQGSYYVSLFSDYGIFKQRKDLIKKNFSKYFGIYYTFFLISYLSSLIDKMNFQLILSPKMKPKMLAKTNSKKTNFASEKKGAVPNEFRAEGVCPP